MLTQQQKKELTAQIAEVRKDIFHAQIEAGVLPGPKASAICGPLHDAAGDLATLKRLVSQFAKE